MGGGGEDRDEGALGDLGAISVFLVGGEWIVGWGGVLT